MTEDESCKKITLNTGTLFLWWISEIIKKKIVEYYPMNTTTRIDSNWSSGLGLLDQYVKNLQTTDAK